MTPLQRPGHPKQVVPVIEDPALTDLALEQRPQMSVGRPGVEPIEPLVGQVADAGCELHAQQVEQGEDQFGVAGRVGGVLQDRQLGLVVEDRVEHVGRVADRGRNDLGAVLRELVRGPGIERQPLAVAEVAG